jgi:hypothetical protein
MKSESPLAGGTGSLPGEEKSDIGRAIRTTPKRETYAAICSIRVKGSLIRKEQAQHARLGARNVMTVASARGR